MVSQAELRLAILLFISSSVIKTQGKPPQTKPGCRYENKWYQEGGIVATMEPCLQCRCVEGSLRCRLRICPRIPQPTPAGCRTRAPGENVCCPELVCGAEEDENENILQRSSSGILHRIKAEEGCLYEGVRYGPGSAMMGSRRCEYCYCISGARRCIRPKCLLPLPGCSPLYTPHSCCPVAYNCTRQDQLSTTLAGISRNGCRTEDRVYEEGEMVRDITWKAACDNCFCAMGAIRCVPLACAPPLQGCKPIVREGQCCPSTYNCSGTIEVKAAQNYASYAFISKDYAKFRKETNFLPALDDITISNIEGRGHRIINEAIESGTVNQEFISKKSTIPNKSILNLKTQTINNEILKETTDNPKHSTCDREQFSTKSTELSTNTDTVISDESVTATQEPVTEESTETTSLFTATLQEATTTPDDTWTQSSSNLTSESTASTNEEVTATPCDTPITEMSVPESTSNIITTLESYDNRDSQGQESQISSHNKINPETMSSKNLNTTMAPKIETITKISYSVKKVEKVEIVKKNVGEQTIKRIVSAEPKKDVVVEKEKGDLPTMPIKKPSAGLSTSFIMPDDVFVMNVTVKTNVAVGNIQGVTINPISKPKPSDIEAIINITNRGKEEDYEYDYSNPTLPPSLPNVRIIPFVAADALVKDKDNNIASPVANRYPPNGIIVSPELNSNDTNFYNIITKNNRFRPPEETEGGFIPREPSYFNPLFHSSDINLEISMGVTVAPEIDPNSNSHRKSDELVSSCLYEHQEYGHGQVLPSAYCVVCMCYYGEIMCSSKKCPPLKIGCQQITNPRDKCCNDIICVDGLESPTVVLDRIDTKSSQYEPTLSSDPFRNVIKTEPAPDLPSLIGDMMATYFVEHAVTTPGNIVDERVEPTVKPNRTFISQYKASNFSPDSVSLINPNTIPNDVIDKPIPNDSIFSLDSVFDLFFNEPTSADLNLNATSTEAATVDETSTEIMSTTSMTRVPPTSSNSTMTTMMTTAITTSTANMSTKSTSSLGNLMTTKGREEESTTGPSEGLLKLAGCNIYGRMYRVGKIIMELSNPCLQCRCTNVGVQCKPLDC